MKLAIDKKGAAASILPAFEAENLAETHRIVDVKFSHSDPFGGAHYVDVWGGTWRVSEMTGETVCTVGAMDKWS